MRAVFQPLEKYVSFGAIGGLLGVCNDVATPLAGSNIYGVIAGAGAVLLGCLSAATLGIRSDVTKGFLGFGVIILAISLFFLSRQPSGPDGDNGYLASRFEVMEKLQGQLLERLDDIHNDTQAIAESTSRIADHTEDLRGFSIDQERFDQALKTGDTRTIALACKSGLRPSAYIFFGGMKGKDGPIEPYEDDRMVSFLMEQDCVQTERLCPDLTEKELSGGRMARFAILDRVALICGDAFRQRVADYQAKDDVLDSPYSIMLR
ncbi:hypothetical protein [Rhizobium leguminosarum]|uniref:hypothetical protein n=1 Tax=Rhizobium leguminosarum TaxID=384 RepID=UPI0010318B86|nr:hypothetical protein [Rhizobium leguminosarum]TBG52590.1 hypothetical protein ELG74_36460 [Rhizobium leguminosarum]